MLFTIIEDFGVSAGEAWTRYLEWRGVYFERFDFLTSHHSDDGHVEGCRIVSVYSTRHLMKRKACSRAVYFGKDGQTITGRTMDWFVSDMDTNMWLKRSATCASVAHTQPARFRAPTIPTMGVDPSWGAV